MPAPVFTPDQEKHIIALYTEEPVMSIGAIAKAYDCHNIHIQQVLVRHEIPRRARGGSAATHARVKGRHGDPGVNYVTNLAIARGDLVRGPCEVCGVAGMLSSGRPAVEAHHDDYNEPYKVRWLCPIHHAEWHENNTAIPATDENSMDCIGFTGVPGRNHPSARKESNE